jgi:hypothetical protein
MSEKEFNVFHKFKTALEGGEDLLVERAHLSVDSRVITIIPEKVESFNAVQGSSFSKI